MKPYKTVMREIGGKMVPVKVYPPAGQKSEKSNYTRFHYEKSAATKSGISKANALSIKRFQSKSRHRKK